MICAFETQPGEARKWWFAFWIQAHCPIVSCRCLCQDKLGRHSMTRLFLPKAAEQATCRKSYGRPVSQNPSGPCTIFFPPLTASASIAFYTHVDCKIRIESRPIRQRCLSISRFVQWTACHHCFPRCLFDFRDRALLRAGPVCRPDFLADSDAKALRIRRPRGPGVGHPTLWI